jgi:hypothetical protein
MTQSTTDLRMLRRFPGLQAAAASSTASPSHQYVVLPKRASDQGSTLSRSAGATYRLDPELVRSACRAAAAAAFTARALGEPATCIRSIVRCELQSASVLGELTTLRTVRAELLCRPHEAPPAPKPFHPGSRFGVRHSGSTRKLLERDASFALRNGSEYGLDHVVEQERLAKAKAACLGATYIAPPSAAQARKAVVTTATAGYDDDALAQEVAAMKRRKEQMHAAGLSTSVRFFSRPNLHTA